MANKLRYALPVLAAFLFMGLSITVSAAKPIKEYTIKSAPLDGRYHECLAVNDTQENLFIEIGLHDRGLLSVVYIELIPEESLKHHNRDPGRQFCVVKWVGQPDDVRASFCSWEGDLGTGNKACLELY